MDRLKKLSSSHGGSTWNLTLIGPAVSEEKMLKECGRRTDGRRMTEAYLSYKLTSEPLAQEAKNTYCHKNAAKGSSDSSYHFGLLVDLTNGDIPSLYSDFVLLKLTMLNITLWNKYTIYTCLILFKTRLVITWFWIQHGSGIPNG